MWNLRKTVGLTLLAANTTVKAAGTGQGVTEGGKSQLGTNFLTLEEVALQNVKLCVPNATSKTNDIHVLPNTVAVVIPPFEKNYVTLSFLVSDVLPSDQDRVLILVYSQGKSPSPQIPTPNSKEKLQVNLSTVEILGLYNLPATRTEAQPSTRIGAANPSPRSKIGFDINLDTLSIPALINTGKDKIYVQAAILPLTDFKNQRYDTMILSEMDEIRLIPNNCPDGYVTSGATSSSSAGYTK